MTTDKDIAQALKSQKQKPSKEWQDATLRRLRDVSENHVTESVGMRNSLRDAVASLASYFFPTSTMNPVFLKTIGSLAAVCVITVGTHAVANGSTPQNSFLYAIDRGFERAELAFASIGGKASVAHKHLIHAEERSTEIDVLLRGEASASLSFKDLLVETAYAQSVGANAQLSAHVQLLVDDCRDSLNKAVAILEEIADNASVKARSELAVAIEMTSKNVSQRLEASAQATAEADVRPAIRKAVDAAKEAERKARRIKASAEVDVEAEVEAEANNDQDDADKSAEGSATIKSNTKVDTRSGIEVETDTSIDTNVDVEIDAPAVEVDTEGGVNLNLGTTSKRRGGGGNATTKTEAEGESKTDASTTTKSDANAAAQAEEEKNEASAQDSQKESGSTEVEANAEMKIEAESSVETDVLDTEVESETELEGTLKGGLN